MATQWFWQNQEGEQGPCSFRDLAEMVRDKILNEDDLVRASHSNEWQTTDSVIGLYHMAKRIPVEREVAPPMAFVEQLNIEDFLLSDEPLIREYKLDEVGRERRLIGRTNTSENLTPESGDNSLEAVTTTVGENSAIDSLTAVESGKMAAAIGAATEAWDSRHASATNEELAGATSSQGNSRTRLLTVVQILTWPGRQLIAVLIQPCITGILKLVFAVGRLLRFQEICLRLERIASRQSLSRWFRLGFSLAVAGIIAYAIVSWSDRIDLRFPDAERLATGKKVFPLYGSCGPMVYAFLLTDAAVLSGVCGYFAARRIESRAEG